MKKIKKSRRIPLGEAEPEGRASGGAAVGRCRLFERSKKKPAASYSRTGESRTTLGDGALNFRVRNGNGCDNSSMATGKKPLVGD